MMEVCLTCGRDGQFRSCCGKGHAGYAPTGCDIVCAAATVLLRTAAQVLLDTCGASVEVNAPVPGNLEFWVQDGIDDESRLIYTADFLRVGLQSLQVEYPQYVAFTEIIAE
ncbi:MAG: ribosomal-processing cysteine protease Prp [Spirochaetaceae bacterium]|nr:ribosomal-processing cysteine protease Prp [Spirochaetaceae bacterium]MBR2362977.1 ribosomal-processing cysteine protease Prp [Spirochaetaceae bacterium]